MKVGVMRIQIVFNVNQDFAQSEVLVPPMVQNKCPITCEAYANF